MKKLDLTFEKFGRLKVKESAGHSGVKTLWLCVCDCGNELKVITNHLTGGNTKSCGCLQLEAISATGKSCETHGHRKRGRKASAEYRCWSNMKQRCYTKSNQAFANYGARGISVCDRWMKSFENFLEDMGLKPSSDLSLDRIDNNGNYSKDNCKWSNDFEQNLNRRTRVIPC